MYEKYIALVLETYRQKKAHSQLSYKLSEPTAAKLKKECISVCPNRSSDSDRKLLGEFFECEEDEGAILQKARRFDPDKFRPLLKFLKGDGKSSTDQKNIELLAWLIDFEPRPFRKFEREEIKKKKNAAETGTPQIPPTSIEKDSGNDPGGEPIEVETPEPGKEDITNTASENPSQDSPVKTPVPEPTNVPAQPKRRTKYLIPLAVLAFLLLAGTLVFNKFKNADANSTTLGAPGLTSNESCMYWAGDHYQQIPCNQKVQGAEVIPLDAEKLQYFKKINCPETIKKSEIEKYWYCKLKTGEVEFYTAEGFHPVDTKRRLKPLTEYMFEKYIMNRTPCP
ncbi:MAG: hypothetical protein ACO1NW_02840 [Chitinophagaceae bacterium]